MPYMSKEDWPTGPTGDYDGLQLLSLVRQNRNPFQAAWDVEILIREIEDVLKTQVIDIPRIDTGSNNYVRSFFHCSLRLRFNLLSLLRAST